MFNTSSLQRQPKTRRRIAATCAGLILATGTLVAAGTGPASAANDRYWSGISCTQASGSSGTQTVHAPFVNLNQWTKQRIDVINLYTGQEEWSTWYYVYKGVAYYRWDYNRWVSVYRYGVAMIKPSFSRYTQVVHAVSDYGNNWWYHALDACDT